MSETHHPPSAQASRWDGDDDWVTAWTVWHVGAKKCIVRHDGKPFRFPRRRRRRK